MTDFGEVKVEFGKHQIRTSIDYKDPFPLYPREELSQDITKFETLAQNQSLTLESIERFVDNDGIERYPGDLYQFPGPGTYIPRTEEKVVKKVKAKIVKPNTALHVFANRPFVDFQGISRIAGERWMVRQTGQYNVHVDEEIQKVIKATVLTDKKSI